MLVITAIHYWLAWHYNWGGGADYDIASRSFSDPFGRVYLAVGHHLDAVELAQISLAWIWLSLGPGRPITRVATGLVLALSVQAELSGPTGDGLTKVFAELQLYVAVVLGLAALVARWLSKLQVRRMTDAAASTLPVRPFTEGIWFASFPAIVLLCAWLGHEGYAGGASPIMLLAGTSLAFGLSLAGAYLIVLTSCRLVTIVAVLSGLTVVACCSIPLLTSRFLSGPGAGPPPGFLNHWSWHTTGEIVVSVASMVVAALIIRWAGFRLVRGSPIKKRG